jgi:ABC-type uncharacterized transport system ATPase subunit
VRLKSKNLHTMGDRGKKCSAASTGIHGGEIVGLAGVSGNGQRELAECLSGLRKVTAAGLNLIKWISRRFREKSGRIWSFIHSRRTHARWRHS